MAKTIIGFSKFIKKIKPNYIIVHGDRVEPLAAACVGCLNNVVTIHLEGGEVSGTVDEVLRHSITKLSHVHMVTNSKAKKRLIQLGENKNKVFIVGSPDVDVILSKNLPSLKIVKNRYGIKFKKFSIAILHPVTTDLQNLENQLNIFFETLKLSKKNYIIIYPNNDTGSDKIIKEILKLKKNKFFKVLPSMRFEYFLTLLKNSYFIIGNSSSGIMEAPYYGVPTINLGNRQNKRFKVRTIHNCKFSKKKILNLINNFSNKTRFKPKVPFGKGNSFKKFKNVLLNDKNFHNAIDKVFNDINF